MHGSPGEVGRLPGNPTLGVHDSCTVVPRRGRRPRGRRRPWHPRPRDLRIGD